MVAKSCMDLGRDNEQMQTKKLTGERQHQQLRMPESKQSLFTSQSQV